MLHASIYLLTSLLITHLLATLLPCHQIVLCTTHSCDGCESWISLPSSCLWVPLGAGCHLVSFLHYPAGPSASWDALFCHRVIQVCSSVYPEYPVRRTLLRLVQHISLHVLNWAVIYLDFAVHDPVRYHGIPGIDVLGSSPFQHVPIRLELEEHGQFVVPV